MATDQTAMPSVLYVQKGIYNKTEEIVANVTPEGALRRDLGKGVVPGARVGIYRLERVVQLAIGIQEIPASPPAEVVSTAGTVASS